MTSSSSSSFTPVFKLHPGVQSYDWGKIGKSSLAAQHAEQSVKGFKADDSKPYAELWMGTHKTLPSYCVGAADEELADRLRADPERYLSKTILEKYPNAADGHLPFLFKVLSIGKALSIQAHPDKKLAEKLHAERGDVYKDPNHKPEMAIALTQFRGFCGFLPLPTLLLLLTTIPEIRSLIGEGPIEALAQSLDLRAPAADADPAALESLIHLAEAASSKSATSDNGFETTDAQKSALRAIFEVLMTSDDNKVVSTLKGLLKRYNEQGKESCKTRIEADLVDLVTELNEQYPDDVGVLCTFVLNVVELGVGEAVFLRADEPHAYISGDIIECMATSDNVVRAGLTPKLRDVPTLVSMLTYTSAPSHAQLLRPEPFDGSDGKTMLYDPPIEEFSVLRLELAGGDKEKHRAVSGPSIVIVTDGEGSVRHGSDVVDVARGEVVFVAAGTEVEWQATKSGLVAFRAFVEVAN